MSWRRYTNLLRVWPEPRLAGRLRELIDLFRRHILNAEQTHLQHFFDEAWTPKSDSYTFGHDIEGSWLLCEAAEVLGDQRLMTEVQSVAVRDRPGGAGGGSRRRMAACSTRVATVGSSTRTRSGGRRPRRSSASTTPGSSPARRAFREAAVRCWQFIQDHVVDHQHGEWFWCIRPDGTPDPSQPKVSPWKCPYHNGRCCLEIIRRVTTAT